MRTDWQTWQYQGFHSVDLFTPNNRIKLTPWHIGTLAQSSFCCFHDRQLSVMLLWLQASLFSVYIDATVWRIPTEKQLRRRSFPTLLNGILRLLGYYAT